MVAESELLDVAELFRQAAFDGSWEAALSAAAQLCGGHAAQMVGFGPAGTAPFNRAHNIDPAGYAEFYAIGGTQPSRNPRLRAGLAAPFLQSLTEADFGDVASLLRSDLYGDLFRRYDIVFNLQSTLMRNPAGVIGFTVIHSERRGMATAEERQAFDALSPLVQEGVRLQLTLEGRGANILRGSLENLGVAAFVCNAAGRVAALTPEAERLAAEGDHVLVKEGMLRAAHPQDAAPLAEALVRAADRVRSTAPAELPLRSPRDGALLVCQVACLPTSEFVFGLDASVMVVARTPRDPSKIAPILQQGYGLTLAEVGVVLGLARGLDLEQIARERSTSAWTVRTQLRAAASKLGVSRQAELVAKLSQL